MVRTVDTHSDLTPLIGFPGMSGISRVVADERIFQLIPL